MSAPFCNYKHAIKEREDIMKEIDKIKAVFTAVVSTINSALGTLFVPVLLVVICNIFDYITGLMASPKRDKKISSYRSIKGIKKKVGMWILIIVGAIVDQLIKYSVEILGFTLPFTFLVACIVAVWLVCNELISILENLKDMGINLPPFLNKIIFYIKDQTEGKADINTKESEE